MHLKPSSYLILGMLNRGIETGYAIKRAVDNSTRFFWAASLAQVYPELAALEAGGLVVSEESATGARVRKVYRLTEPGRAALDRWLNGESTPAFEFRDEGLLRLFFADAMEPEQALGLVKRLREGAEQADRDFRSKIMPLADRDPGRFPRIAAREGADYFSWRAAWFRRLEDELVEELRVGSAGAPSPGNPLL